MELNKSKRQSNLFCMAHPSYDAATPPILACKTCCKNYVDHVISKQNELREQKGIDVDQWKEKKQASAQAPVPAANDYNHLRHQNL